MFNHRGLHPYVNLLRNGLLAVLFAGSALFAFSCQPALAQSSDDGFNPGANGSVLALAIQADGKILVGGGFTFLGGETRNYIARLNPDGTLDKGFNPGANNNVNTLALQSDGKILIGGDFTSLDDQTCTRIGRLNPDGSLDTTFSSGTDSSVLSLVVQANGKILVGGWFTSLVSETRNYIGRLNTDGSLDISFNPGANGVVYGLMVQTDHKILVVGDFTKLGGQTHNYIGRINPDDTLDSTFNPGANNVVYAVGVQADGKIVVGGDFTTLDKQPRDSIGRLNFDGTLDTTYNPGADAWGFVSVLTIQADGKIVVGGFFANLGGGFRNYIGRLNLDGTLDPTFDRGAGNIPWALAVQTDGKTIVGGQFTILGGQPRDHIGRFNPDGTLDMTINPAADDEVITLAVQSDGKILVGGGFTLLGGEVRNHIARLNPDGSLDPSFIPVTNGDVYNLVVQEDGKILLGGFFTTLNDVERNHIGRLNPNGSLDTDFNPGANDWVLTMALQPDGKIVVGGNFTLLGGSPRDRIARLNPNGSLDQAFNPGANSYVHALAVQPSGKILVGGAFNVLGGETRERIGRLNSNGSLDTAFNPGADGYGVMDLVQQPDGRILVGGSFSTLGGQQRNFIGRLNTDGSLDTTFNPDANLYVYTMALQADRKILVGGDFTQLGGEERNSIARLNPDGSLDTTFNPGANEYVLALTLQTDGKVLIGGPFTMLDGLTREHFGRLSNDTAALQNLSVDSYSTNITWGRSGSGPEVRRTTFELSTDGVNYIWLGNGSRVVGGWQLSGLSLPFDQNLFIRARGFFPTGLYNGSGSVVEAVVNVYLNQPPVANAGSDQIVNTNALVTLDGSASHDPDNNLPLTFLWTQTGGPAVVLSDKTAVSSTFTAPDDPAVLTFNLTVSDSLGLPDPTPEEVMISVTNQPPVADAGSDQSVNTLVLVTLDGSGSFDPDNDLPLSYWWTQTGGPAVVLSDRTVIAPTFAGPDDPAVLTFSLSITDSLDLPDPTSDKVLITVTNQPPVADAGLDQSVNTLILVSLDGSGSFEPDNDLPLSYLWTQTGGPAVVLSDRKVIAPTFAGPDDPAVLTFSLSITDSLDLPDPTSDDVLITVTNQPPVADAGLDQSVNTLILVTLDGSGSFDPDNDLPLSYLWTQTGGPAVVLSDRTVVTPTFTAPGDSAILTFTLSVTDSLGLPVTTPDEIVIIVQPYRLFIQLVIRY